MKQFLHHLKALRKHCSIVTLLNCSKETPGCYCKANNGTTKQCNHSNARAAFTLIELIIYVAITAIVVVSLTNVMITVFETRARTEKISELQQSLRLVADRMANTVIGAEEVRWSSSKFMHDQGMLSVMGSDGVVTYFFKGDAVYVQEGTNASVRISSPDITITKLRFENRTADETPATIKVIIRGSEMQSELGTEDPNEMEISTTFSLRQ